MNLTVCEESSIELGYSDLLPQEEGHKSRELCVAASKGVVAIRSDSERRGK